MGGGFQSHKGKGLGRCDGCVLSPEIFEFTKMISMYIERLSFIHTDARY